MKKVLFVCSQNTCRSPMLMYVFRQFLKENNLDDSIACDSAGVMSFGDGINQTCAKVMLKNGVPYDNFASKACSKALLEWADVAFAMTIEQAQYLQHFAISNNVFLKVLPLCDVCGVDVEDPYGKGEDAYQALLWQFENMSSQIFEAVKM